MRCLTGSEIDRYVSGTMEQVVAEGVTKHLLACNRCRLAVSEARGNKPEINTAQATLDQDGKEEPRPLIKIECSSCGSRYGIPSDRIKGRVIKIRCKKCNDLIRIQNKDARAQEPAVEGEGRVWFVVINRKRRGPYTEPELRRQFDEGKVKARSYAWRQGYDKWERLGQIPEFGDLAGRRSADPPEPFDEPTRQASIQPEVLAAMDGDSGVRTAFRPGVRVPDSALQTAYRPTEGDSEDGLQTAYRPAGGAADSAVNTAYRPVSEIPENDRVTNYVLPDDPEQQAEEPDEESDDGLTAIHYKQKDPLEGLAEVEDPLDEPLNLDRPPVEQDPVDPFQYPAAAAAFDEHDTDEADTNSQRQAEPAEPAEPPKPRQESLESGAWEQRMRGQRHDESVLFSLKHLQNLADGRPDKQDPEVKQPISSDGSGLFDIQPLTAGPPAVPLVMAPAPREGRRIGLGLVFLVGMLGMLVGAAVLVVALMVTRPQVLTVLLQDPATVQTGSRAPVAEATAPVKGSTVPVVTAAKPAPPAPRIEPTRAAPDAAPLATAAPLETPDAGSAEPSPDQQVTAVAVRLKPARASISSTAKRQPKTRRRKPRRRVKPRPVTTAALPAAAPATKPAAKDPDEIAVVDPDTVMDPDEETPTPAAKKSPPAAAAAKKPAASKGTKKAGDAELDALIDAATKGKLPPSQKAAADKKPAPKSAPAGPKTLNRDQVGRGMRMAAGAVRACRQRFQTAGVVTVKATISGTGGRITRGTVVGPFAGSQVGACVLAAARSSCRFPRFSGPSLTVKYPFVLR